LKFLPSKKFIILFVIVLLVIAVILLIKNLNKDENLVSNDPSESQQNNVEELDTDKDGLADWKEALWKTDVKNPDTDGDGTLDGEEVKINRNPTKPFPNDQLTEEEIKSLSGTVGDSSLQFNQVSKTDELMESFLMQYVLQKSLNDGILDESAKEALMQSVLGETSLKLPFKTYTMADIKISTSDDAISIKQYGNDMGAIVKKYDPQINMLEIAPLLKKSVETKDVGGLVALKDIVEKYSNMINESLKISTPKSAVNSHLDFINGASRVAEMFLGVYRSTEDPLSGLIAIGDFQNTISKLENTNSSITSYFQKKGVVYKTGEDGYIFANGAFQ